MQAGAEQHLSAQGLVVLQDHLRGGIPGGLLPEGRHGGRAKARGAKVEAGPGTIGREGRSRSGPITAGVSGGGARESQLWAHAHQLLKIRSVP